MSHAMQIVTVALGVELLLVLLGLLVFSGWRNRAARRRDTAAVRALVARIRNGRSAREAVIEQFLSERLGMSGDTLRHAQVGLVHAELGLLQRLAVTYLRRDATAVASLDQDLYATLEAYHALAAGGADAGGADSGEVENLRAENKRLSDELRTTMETMSRMLKEYSSVFGDPAPVGTEGPATAAAETAEPRVAPFDPAPLLEEGAAEVMGFDEPDAPGSECDDTDGRSEAAALAEADEADGVAADLEQPPQKGQAGG